MSDNKYWVVEYRLPKVIEDADSATEAAELAREQLYRETGIEVNHWFARVFRYGGDVDEFGVQEEWFFNPTGVAARVIEQNHLEHEEIVKSMPQEKVIRDEK